jgi:hypothetical protein
MAFQAKERSWAMVFSNDLTKVGKLRQGRISVLTSKNGTQSGVKK